ncbi:hypothetical protein BpHYR1_024689, partial [Brachionus plicatilis]
ISYSKQACGDDLLGGHLCSVRFKNNLFCSERNDFFWVSVVKEYDFEVVDPGPQEPTIRLLNFDLEILMLILGVFDSEKFVNVYVVCGNIRIRRINEIKYYIFIIVDNVIEFEDRRSIIVVRNKNIKKKKFQEKKKK